MILHPGILALLTGSSLVFAMVVYAAVAGMGIARGWDFDSSSERQLLLERKTHLVSTVVSYALGFEILSLLLFVHTTDDLHPLFSGAMCATGSLNANPVGWSALAARLLVAFVAALWIVLNHVDQRAPDYPLVRTKYWTLLGLMPVVGLALFLQLRYFVGLEPEIITSCCGALFSAGSPGLASQIAALPARPTMAAFYATAALFLGVAWFALRFTAPALRYLLSGLSVVALVVSLAGIVSFVSVYVYELPTHHCPFDMFQGRYGWVAYPLYASLFTATFLGALPGFLQPLKRIPSLSELLWRQERRWINAAMACMAIFLTVSSWPVLFGPFSLEAYF